jgi:hypothetical protein
MRIGGKGNPPVDCRKWGLSRDQFLQHVKLKLEFSMRFGRILLAVLAPLLSVSPALKAEVTPESHAPAVDSLLNLLRSVVPAAVVTADAASHVTARTSPIAGFIARPFFELNLVPRPSASAAARLRLLTRQQQRLLLRC